MIKKPKPQHHIIEKQNLPKQTKTTESKPESIGDVEAISSDLDTMLNKYEDMLAEKINTKQVMKADCEPITTNIPDSSTKVMKPRVRIINCILKITY